MKLTSEPRIELLYQQDNLVIPCVKGQVRLIQQVINSLGKVDRQKDYEVSISPRKRKRSKDANAYLWTLIGKLSDKLKLPKTEVYREHIKEMDTFTIVPIKVAEIDDWVRNWERGHDGWVCIDMGECRNFAGYHNIKCYKGSSTFDARQMSRLIDMVVDSCKEQGIETMTPAEIERLKTMWGDG